MKVLRKLEGYMYPREPHQQRRTQQHALEMDTAELAQNYSSSSRMSYIEIERGANHPRVVGADGRIHVVNTSMVHEERGVRDSRVQES